MKMQIGKYITRRSPVLACAVLAIALSSFSAAGAKKTETVGALKWTYSIGGESVCIVGVAPVQDGRVEGVVEVPASFNGGAHVVTALGYQAFDGKEYLQEVKLPPSVDKIGQECFRGCKRLATLKLPSMVQTINASAFRDCAGLRSITLNEGLVTIGEYAFRGCDSLTAIAFPSTLKSIKRDAFGGTPLEAVELPDSLKELGPEAFSECGSLATVSIGKGLAVLPYQAFAGCGNLRSVTVKDGRLEAIKQECFRDCKRLVEVKIPASVRKIEKSALNGCPIKSPL